MQRLAAADKISKAERKFAGISIGSWKLNESGTLENNNTRGAIAFGALEANMKERKLAEQ